MIFWILACLGVYLVNIYSAGVLLMARIGPTAFMGPRDTLPEPGKHYARLQKAASNFAESLPLFLTLALLVLVVEGVDKALAEQGAMIFVLARVAYIAVYVSGVPLIRSLVFVVGMTGLLLMGFSLF